MPEVPIAVLTSRDPIPVGGIFTQEFVDAFRAIWYEAHEMLTQSVTNGTHIFAEHSSHQVQWDEPQLVIDAIQQVLTATQ
jgi:hypothetical protein